MCLPPAPAQVGHAPIGSQLHPAPAGEFDWVDNTFCKVVGPNVTSCCSARGGDVDLGHAETCAEMHAAARAAYAPASTAALPCDAVAPDGALGDGRWDGVTWGRYLNFLAGPTRGCCGEAPAACAPAVQVCEDPEAYTPMRQYQGTCNDTAACVAYRDGACTLAPAAVDDGGADVCAVQAGDLASCCSRRNGTLLSPYADTEWMSCGTIVWQLGNVIFEPIQCTDASPLEGSSLSASLYVAYLSRDDIDCCSGGPSVCGKLLSFTVEVYDDDACAGPSLRTHSVVTNALRGQPQCAEAGDDAYAGATMEEIRCAEGEDALQYRWYNGGSCTGSPVGTWDLALGDCMPVPPGVGNLGAGTHAMVRNFTGCKVFPSAVDEDGDDGDDGDDDDGGGGGGGGGGGILGGGGDDHGGGSS